MNSRTILKTAVAVLFGIVFIFCVSRTLIKQSSQTAISNNTAFSDSENSETKNNYKLDENKQTDEDNNASDNGTGKQEPDKVFITFRPEDVRAEAEKNMELNPDERARYYAYDMGLSKQNAYNLMTSAQFDNLPEKESIEALENLNYDWKRNAVKKAQAYSDEYHFSAKEISDILSSEEIDGFTMEEADYAAYNSNINYQENALYILNEYVQEWPDTDESYFVYLTEYRRFTDEEANYAIENKW